MTTNPTPSRISVASGDPAEEAISEILVADLGISVAVMSAEIPVTDDRGTVPGYMVVVGDAYAIIPPEGPPDCWLGGLERRLSADAISEIARRLS